MEISTGDLRINCSIEGIEGNIHRLHTSIAQSFRHCLGGRDFTSEQSAVRGKTDARNLGDFGNSPNEINYATTCQRFSTSNPHLRDAKLGRDANEPQG